jgi:EAL and modified HD-GYP domain-containing signal transduction protein
MVELLAPGRFVLEILETVWATPALVARIQGLKARGFSFALDDFSGETPNNAPFLDLVDIVKVDIEQVPADFLDTLVRALRRHRAILLAEKIEDAATHQRCLNAGFELFQGYHFARPQVLVGKRPDPQLMHVRGLLERVMGYVPGGKPKSELNRQSALGGVLAWNCRLTPRPAG